MNNMRLAQKTNGWNRCGGGAAAAAVTQTVQIHLDFVQQNAECECEKLPNKLSKLRNPQKYQITVDAHAETQSNTWYNPPCQMQTLGDTFNSWALVSESFC